MKETLAKGMSAALALGLIAPGMAFAADADHTPSVTGDDVKVTAAEEGGSEGTTAVTWVADDSQLDITVPNTIHVVAKADGNLMVPTNATITNNSVFAVHGTKYVTADAGVTLVEDVTAEDGSKDVMEMQVTATGAAMDMGPAGEHTIAVGDLNINKKSASTLGLTGKVKLANDPATVPTDAFTVEWHFQAGLAKEATIQIEKDAFQSVLNDTVKHINFSATPVPGGKDMEPTGAVTAIQDGDTLNIMSAPGVTVALPADSSELMSADNGGSNLETIVGDLDFADVTSIKGVCKGDTKLTDASAFAGNGTMDVTKTDPSGGFADAPNLDPGFAEDWGPKDEGVEIPKFEPAVFNPGVPSDRIPEIVRPEIDLNEIVENSALFKVSSLTETSKSYYNFSYKIINNNEYIDRIKTIVKTDRGEIFENTQSISQSITSKTLRLSDTLSDKKLTNELGQSFGQYIKDDYTQGYTISVVACFGDLNSKEIQLGYVSERNKTPNQIWLNNFGIESSGKMNTRSLPIDFRSTVEYNFNGKDCNSTALSKTLDDEEFGKALDYYGIRIVNTTKHNGKILYCSNILSSTMFKETGFDYKSFLISTYYKSLLIDSSTGKVTYTFSSPAIPQGFNYICDKSDNTVYTMKNGKTIEILGGGATSASIVEKSFIK